MNKKTLKISRAQRGFAMLEVMLAVLIIALASFGIYKLYSGSSTRNNASSVEDVVSQVSAAVDRYATTYMAQPTYDNLRNSGFLSNDLLSCTTSGSTTTCAGFKSMYGPITYVVNGTLYNGFKLTIPNVPPAAANDLAKSMKNLAGTVEVGTRTFVGDGNDPVPTAAGNIILTFPKV